MSIFEQYQSPAELAAKLGLTSEEAASIWRGWSYTPPTGDALRLHTLQAGIYEDEMRLHNFVRNTEGMSDYEYECLEELTQRFSRQEISLDEYKTLQQQIHALCSEQETT